MRKVLIAALVLFSGHAQAQMTSLSFGLSPRPLPSGVSIPNIATTDTVYPGCPAAPTSFGNVWHFNSNPGVGKTQAGWTAAGVSSLNPTVTPHQGDATHPWLDLAALFGGKPTGSLQPTTGYSQMLLSTAPRGIGGTPGPIQPGDEILLATGTYGTVAMTDPGSVNSPAVTIAPESGQNPVIGQFTLHGASGFVFDGTNGVLQFRSIMTGVFDANALIDINNGGSGSNFIFNHLDVSSASVATSHGWSQIDWQNNARAGIVVYGGNCVSVTNSHVYVVQQHNNGAIDDLIGNNFLAQQNEVDHYSTDAFDFSGNNVAIINNYVHDAVNVAPSSGDQYYVVRNNGSFSTPQTNFTMSRNKMIESIDPSQLFQSPIFVFLNSSGDITNVSIYDNLYAGTGCGSATGIAANSIHDAIVANNSLIDVVCDANIGILAGHGGGTGPEGIPPSNVAVFNNIAGSYDTFGPNVQFYNNISTQSGGAVAWVLQDNGLLLFINSTAGSITTLEASAACCASPPTSDPLQITGHNNIIDGKGQTNEFTAVPIASSFPMSPQPDWTPLTGSPAATHGGAVLIPPITDFNRVAFTPPYNIGALATTGTPIVCSNALDFSQACNSQYITAVHR